ERRRDGSDELAGAVEEQPPPRPRLGFPRQRLEELRLRLRSDARHRAQPAGGRRLAKLLGGPSIERPRQLQRALGPEPEVAAETDEVGGELALELRQLGDLPRLDQLAELSLDAATDSAQLARPPRTHQVGHRHPRAADRLRRAAVGAHAVRVRVAQVEHRRERLQAVGDPSVVHRGSVAPTAVRIATWNVNSVKQRLPRLLPWLDERRPDVVCLQETKLADAAFTELLADDLDQRGYAIALHGEAAWNGVAILSRVGL